eukprot:7975664-Ditylum_brightwellii.AAC.1
MARAKPKATGKNDKTVNKVEHDQTNNDTGYESNWYGCKYIHPGEYKACKEAVIKLKVQHNNNKHMKCSN